MRAHHDDLVNDTGGAIKTSDNLHCPSISYSLLLWRKTRQASSFRLNQGMASRYDGVKNLLIFCVSLWFYTFYYCKRFSLMSDVMCEFLFYCFHYPVPVDWFILPRRFAGKRVVFLLDGENFIQFYLRLDSLINFNFCGKLNVFSISVRFMECV